MSADAPLLSGESWHFEGKHLVASHDGPEKHASRRNGPEHGDCATAHELAFVERTAQTRRDYLASLLAAAPYHPEIYSRCKKFCDEFQADYSIHRRRVRYDADFHDDWGLLSLRQRWYMIMEFPLATKMGRAFAAVQILVTLGALITLLLETEVRFNPIIHPQNEGPFWFAEIAFTLYYTLELCCKIYVHPRRGMLFRSVAFWADLLSSSSLFLTVAGSAIVGGVPGLGALRMLRILRISRYLRFNSSAQILLDALEQSAVPLIGIYFFAALGALVVSTLMFYAERGTFDRTSGRFSMPNCTCEASAAAHHPNSSLVCPRISTDFSLGIFIAMWWGVLSLFSSGTGSLVPQCGGGKFLASVVMIASAAVVGGVVAVLRSALAASLERTQARSSSARFHHAMLQNRFQQRLLQVIAAGRLNEVREEKLAQACQMHRLPVGTREAMVRDLYDFFGVDADCTMNKKQPVPVVLTLSEAFLEYLRNRLPVTVVDLMKPRDEVVDIIDNFMERIYAAQTGADSTTLNLRLENLDFGVRQAIVPLWRRPRYHVGIRVPGVDDPDVVIPLRKSEEHPPVAMGPRMACIDVLSSFGSTKFVMHPLPPFVPLVNNHPVSSSGILLNDGDIINFGTEAYPVIYTFSILDYYSRVESRIPPVSDELSVRLWANAPKHPKLSAHSSMETPERGALRRRNPSPEQQQQQYPPAWGTGPVGLNDIQASFML